MAEQPKPLSARCLAALAHAQKGFRVFPLVPGSKKPAIDSWPEQATTDEATIRAWWGSGRDYNIGIACGRASGDVTGLWLTVPDYDMKAGQQGGVALAMARLEGWAATYQVRTPHGQHLYFWSERLVANSVGKIAPNVDIRGHRGYVVAAGSTVDGAEYVEDARFGVARLPLELELAAARVVSPKNVIQTDLKDIDTTKTIDEAKAYLINEAPEAITGQRGNDTTYRVAARAMDIGVSPGVAFELMWGFWNDSKAMPPWSAAELTRIVENAGRYRQQPIGVANPAVEFEEVIKAERERAETAGLPWYDIAGWDGSEPPERLWAVLDLVPRPQVGLFSGAGGGGKSIIELTRNVAHVTGSEWFGHTVTKGGAFYLGCEDDADEIWRRLAVIARHYGVSFQQLDKLGLKILPLLGEDAVLAKWDAANQKMRPTALYEALLSEARRHRPANISIDPLARAFAGNEIERTQVYQFAQLLQKLALTSGGSVTVLAHPSLQGMASGSGISGSTAWHDAFRFRMFLRGMKAGKDDEEDITGDLRNLEFLKNQYGRKGTTLKLKWTAGMFTPVVDSEAERLARQGWADDVFLDLLARFEREGRYVNNTPHSPGLLYAPKGFVGEPEATNHRLSAADLKGAMDRLFRAEKIHVGERKAGGHKRSCLMLGAGPKAK